MAELADAQDLGSCGEIHAGSIPVTRTIVNKMSNSVCICHLFFNYNSTLNPITRKGHTMKIVMIHGQNRKGSTYHIGQLFAQKLSPENDVTEFFLPRDLNCFCLGCYTCIEKEESCPFYSEKKIILDAMEEAELFIFTTPTYCMGPSAPLKALLDLFFDYWMVHRPKEWMFYKKALIVSTAAGSGTKLAIRLVEKSLTYWGIPYIKTYGTAVHAMNWESVKQDKKNKIFKDVERLSKKIRKVNTPKPGIKKRFLFNMMRKMHAAGWDSSPVEKEYWEKQGWLGKERPWRKTVHI